jgi:hypothetical protein
VPGDGLADLSLGGSFIGATSSNMTSHDFPHSLSNVGQLGPVMIIPLRNEDTAGLHARFLATVSATPHWGCEPILIRRSMGAADLEISTLGST